MKLITSALILAAGIIAAAYLAIPTYAITATEEHVIRLNTKTGQLCILRSIASTFRQRYTCRENPFESSKYKIEHH